MNPSLLGVLAAIALATGLWWSGRRPRPLLKSTATDAVAALNRTQNTLVREARQRRSTAPQQAEPPTGGWEERSGAWAPRQALAPLTTARLSARERQAWLRELWRHHRAGGRQRLAAMRRARDWGAREVLPLLQQGLRDPDPQVMREAARALEAFRGRPGARQAPVAPRSVARTR